MKLSIVTINYNDASGLAKTLKSVADQHIPDGFELEHIIIDGASTDNSVDVIKQYPHVSKWISEKDNGVYHAMNKGIKIALGLRDVDSFNRSKRSEDKTKGGSSETEHYIQILNSGDILAAPDVLARMSEFLNSQILDGKYIEILYGNMLKTKDAVHVFRDNCGALSWYNPSSFLYFYRGTLNHDCAWIHSTLFERLGLYDEDMRICSDWKWYVNAIALGGIKPVYVDVDVTIFDMNGISESGGKNKAIIQKERRGYLEEILPASVLRDYDEYHLPIEQYRRLQRYHLWGIVYFIERVLFKLEKWGVLK